MGVGEAIDAIPHRAPSENHSGAGGRLRDGRQWLVMTQRLTLPEKPSGLARFVPGVGSIIDGARQLRRHRRVVGQGAPPGPRHVDRSGLMDRVGQDHVFLEVDDAVSELLDS